MLDDLLLQLDHMLLQVHHHTAQVRVLALQQLHLVLQLRDSLQLPLAALGRRYPIPLPLPLQLLPFLVVHVDGTERGRIGHRLWLILDYHRCVYVCKERGKFNINSCIGILLEFVLESCWNTSWNLIRTIHSNLLSCTICEWRHFEWIYSI